MIKLSDISVTVRGISEDYYSGTEVTAHWERWEKTLIHRDDASPKVIEREKERVRLRLVQRVYEDLIDPIEELYHVAAMSRDADPVRLRELYGKIRAIMEARG